MRTCNQRVQVSTLAAIHVTTLANKLTLLSTAPEASAYIDTATDFEIPGHEDNTMETCKECAVMCIS